MKLTPRQLEIVDFIRSFSREHGYSPTLDEMAAEMGVSKVTIFEHLKALERKGAVVRSYHKARSVELAPELVRGPDDATVLPLVGTIAAGAPIEALETPDTIDITQLFQTKGEPFVLQVRGNSMIEDGVNDGDYVIIERRDTARDGETVVALLPDGEATLKRFYREKGRIRLQPANSTMEPIYVNADDLQIQGVVVGVLRRY
ncbi:MAG: transcriptional repressor LexA [Planctomycetes bacterium]|nr:transcriptional repressor LexA [Planctomycetota bacterium]